MTPAPAIGPAQRPAPPPPPPPDTTQPREEISRGCAGYPCHRQPAAAAPGLSHQACYIGSGQLPTFSEWVMGSGQLPTAWAVRMGSGQLPTAATSETSVSEAADSTAGAAAENASAPAKTAPAAIFFNISFLNMGWGSLTKSALPLLTHIVKWFLQRLSSI